MAGLRSNFRAFAGRSKTNVLKASLQQPNTQAMQIMPNNMDCVTYERSFWTVQDQLTQKLTETNFPCRCFLADCLKLTTGKLLLVTRV